MATRGQGTKWEFTATALERLLARLDADADRAAEAYEVLRQTLTRFFDWRGAHFPDECADEAINRLARRLDAGRSGYRIRGPDRTTGNGPDDGVDDPRKLREAPDARLARRQLALLGLDDRVAELVS